MPRKKTNPTEKVTTAEKPKRKYVRKKPIQASAKTRGGLTIHEGAQHNYRLRRTSEVYGNFNKDVGDVVREYDRRQLVSKSRYYIANLPLIQSSVEEIATYSSQGGFNPVFNGKDKEWGALAKDFLKKWYQSVDLYGNDMATVLWQISLALDSDGDIGIQLSGVNENKYPIVNLIPSHRITSEEEEIKTGPYKGSTIVDGVVYQNNLPIAYNVQTQVSGSNSVEYVIGKSNMLLLAEPRYPGQVRGYPSLSSCISSLSSYRNIVAYEEEAIKQAASLAFVERNEVGGVLPGEELFGMTSSFSQYDGSTQAIRYQYYDSPGGIIRYFSTADPNSGLEQVKSDRPGSNTAEFIKDHILRHIYNGLGWPLELSYNMSGLNSANTRAILAKIDRKLKHRQATLTRAVRRMVTYAIAKAIKSGYLPRNDEWFSWSFTLPKSPTIDLGREVRSDIDLLKISGTTLSNIIGKSGDEFESVIKQRVAELTLIKEECEKSGIPFELMYSTSPNPSLGDAQRVMENNNDEEEN